MGRMATHFCGLRRNLSRFSEKKIDVPKIETFQKFPLKIVALLVKWYKCIVFMAVLLHSWCICYPLRQPRTAQFSNTLIYNPWGDIWGDLLWQSAMGDKMWEGYLAIGNWVPFLWWFLVCLCDTFSRILMWYSGVGEPLVLLLHIDSPFICPTALTFFNALYFVVCPAHCCHLVLNSSWGLSGPTCRNSHIIQGKKVC